MTSRRLVLRSLAHHWRTGLAATGGLVVATAVITGSLVIGDSVRGSLRDTALSRLGAITHALVAPGLFRAQLAADLAHEPSLADLAPSITPALVTQGTTSSSDTQASVPSVAVVGVEEGFWKLYPGPPAPQLSGRQCALSAALARDLGLAEGADVLVTAARQGALAGTTLFTRRGREDTAPTLRLQVARVLPPGGAGDFRLDARSGAPRNVFISRRWLAERLEESGRANTLLVAGKPAAPESVTSALNAALAKVATLADRGLRLKLNPAHGYLSLMSEGMLIPEGMVEPARAAAGRCGAPSRLTSVYLATQVWLAGKPPESGLPYCVVAGMDPLPARQDGAGLRTLAAGQILLNAWAAQNLKVGPGATLDLTYLRPTDDGTYRTARISGRVVGVLPMSGLGADPGLPPDFEGITNARRMSDWRPPFPVNLAAIKPRDEAYWAKYRAAPKLFLSPDVVLQMWQSGPQAPQTDWETSLREGRGGAGITSVRLALPPGMSLRDLEARYSAALLSALAPAQAGLVFRPVREQALRAAEGSSDFGQLFLGLSMFLVFSGLGLAATLLRLSVDQRASEVGMMLACGLGERLVGRVLLAEGAFLAAVGALAGVPAGLGYAALILGALGRWWQGALGATTSLALHVTAASLVTGGASGLAAGLLAAAWSTRRLRGQRPLALLAGWQAMSVAPGSARRGRAGLWLALSLILAAALGVLSVGTRSLAPEGAFFGIGCALLVAGLAAARLALDRSLAQRGASRSLHGERATSSLARLAVRNAATGGGRSLLVVGLLACATFVIVAVAANTRDFSRLDVSRKDSGAGGFSLLATSSVPLSFDPATPAGRAHLGFPPEDEAALQGTQIISLLASHGEDISCLNLTRPTTPRLLAVPPALIQRAGFTILTPPGAKPANPWTLLNQGTSETPAFGDADSVRWTLHSDLGQVFEMPGPDARPLKLAFAGLLSGSIFQSDLLVGEAAFRRLFPGVSGPSVFLISTPPGKQQQVAQALRRNLGDLGVQVRSTREILNEYTRVQNTYLGMFLALGGLGLLLGTVGLATVVLRSAYERRAELALMSATGFSGGRVAGLLLLENLGLLLAGLLCGLLTALVAVGPQMASSQTRVNWPALGTVLAAVLVVGLTTCAAAVKGAVRGPLLGALRHE